MQSANIYAQYKAQSLETLTNGEIVVKLFEETSKQITAGIFHTSQNEHVKAYNSIAKAQKIVSTLSTSLDMHFPISGQLRSLYDFVHEELGRAIVAKDTTKMEEALAIVDELKVTFRQAERLARAGRR